MKIKEFWETDKNRCVTSTQPHYYMRFEQVRYCSCGNQMFLTKEGKMADKEKMEVLTLPVEIKLHTWVMYKAGVLTKKDVRSVLNVLENIGTDDTINVSLEELKKIKEE